MSCAVSVLGLSPHERHLDELHLGRIQGYQCSLCCLCQDRLLTVWCMRLQGQLLAVSPYESHLDERLFGPRAHEFDPGRPGVAAVMGVAGVGGIAGFAFGGGRYRY